MLATVGQCVNFVKLLELMVVHHSSAMMIFGTLFTKTELLIQTVNFSSFILTVHALIVILQKLLLTSYGEVDLVLDLISLLIIYHKIVLEGFFLTITLQKYRIYQAYFIIYSSNSSQIQSTKQKRKYFTRSNL